MQSSDSVFTVGHSTYPWEQFLALLKRWEITAIADVRSAPYSRYTPHFGRDSLSQLLRQEGIAYVFLGKELGGRPRDRALFTNRLADYEKMANVNSFRHGLQRVIDGAKRYRIAVMCSEREPLDCHRCLLIGRELMRLGVSVDHVLADGGIASHDKIEQQLLEMAELGSEDLFSPRSERLSIAYRDRARKVAFAEATPALLP
jgi:uncharacterized protein (DUF488 family)